MGQLCSCVEPRRKKKRPRRLSDASTEGYEYDGALAQDDDDFSSDSDEIRILIDGDVVERDSSLPGAAASSHTAAVMTKRNSKSALLLRGQAATAVVGNSAHAVSVDDDADASRLLGETEADPLSATEQHRNMEVLRSYRQATGVVDHGQQDLECVMCLDTFSSDNPKVRTLCNCGMNRTNFHLSCLLEWLNRDANCPVCRQYLFYEEP